MARLKDGFSTTVAFADFPSVTFYEKTVKPPGWDGGGMNDTTTMRNTALRTRQPKYLKTMTDIQLNVSFSSETFDDIGDMVNVNQLITVTFPDGATWAFWGWLDKFEPNEFREGEQPTAQITLVCSNENDSGVETEPVYTAA